MKILSAFIILVCASLALCQTQSDPPTSTAVTNILNDVSSQTPSEADNVTLSGNVDAVNSVLSFGENVIFIASNRLATLPTEVRSSGEKILLDTREGVQTCEDALRRNGTIWEYKVCCSSYLRYAMSGLAGLAQASLSVGSGAARPRLFFM